MCFFQKYTNWKHIGEIASKTCSNLSPLSVCVKYQSFINNRSSIQYQNIKKRLLLLPGSILSIKLNRFQIRCWQRSCHTLHSERLHLGVSDFSPAQLLQDSRFAQERNSEVEQQESKTFKFWHVITQRRNLVQIRWRHQSFALTFLFMLCLWLTGDSAYKQGHAYRQLHR